MKTEEIKEVVETARGVSDISLSKSVLAQALVQLWTNYERVHKAAMLCPQEGRTGPCTYQPTKQGHLRRCFKCGSLHPEDANSEYDSLSHAMDETEKNIEDAKNLASMLVFSASGIPKLQWVDVLAREILTKLKEE